MKATFEQRNENEVEIELQPEGAHEQMLLALWLRYDANQVSATKTERHQDGRIYRVRLSAARDGA